MMSFLLMMMFMIPLCFFSYWVFLLVFFYMSFLFLVKMSFSNMFMSVSYCLGVDLLSYTLIILSFWICALMILASEKLLKNKNYFNLFLLMVLFLMISLYLTFSSMNLFIFYFVFWD